MWVACAKKNIPHGFLKFDITASPVCFRHRPKNWMNRKMTSLTTTPSCYCLEVAYIVVFAAGYIVVEP